MKYYVLKYRYLHTTSRIGNLGDNIQSIAATCMLTKIGIDQSDIDYLNRDDLALEKRKHVKGILLAQGWFGCMPGQQSLPISDTIHPLYFGFHINEGSWHLLKKNDAFIRSMLKHQPIGCRDLGTRDFLRKLDVKAFYSRCLSMTLAKRSFSVSNGLVFLVDVPFDLRKYIPENLIRRSVELTQFGHTGREYSPSGRWPMDENDVRAVNQVAQERLDIFKKKASLIITSRIHVAMPAAAMGIPVIYCYYNKLDIRASVIKEILPVYEPSMYKEINWYPKPLKMEKLKYEIELMLRYRLQVVENNMGYGTSRLSADDSKKAEALLTAACEDTSVSIPYQAVPYSRDDVLETAFGKHKWQIENREIPFIIFGAGSAGRHICAILQYFNIQPFCFCDNGVKTDTEREINQLPVITFNSLKSKYKTTLILIATKNFLEPIRCQLLRNGFNDNMIINGSYLIDRYIDFAIPTITK